MVACYTLKIQKIYLVAFSIPKDDNPLCTVWLSESINQSICKVTPLKKKKSWFSNNPRINNKKFNKSPFIKANEKKADLIDAIDVFTTCFKNIQSKIMHSKAF